MVEGLSRYMRLTFIKPFGSAGICPVATCFLLPAVSPIYAVAVFPPVKPNTKREPSLPPTLTDARIKILFDADDGVIVADKPVIVVKVPEADESV